MLGFRRLGDGLFLSRLQNNLEINKFMLVFGPILQEVHMVL